MTKTVLMGVAVALLVFAATASLAADGQIKIAQTSSTTFPIVINQSGSYVLTTKLVVPLGIAGITIEANDVTLDLNGHTIQGNGAACACANGIESIDKYNVTVKNGKIWGFHFGVLLLSHASHHSYMGAGHLTDNIQALNNNTGIEVYGGLVTNCVANNNAHTGIDVTNSTLTNCTANKNGSTGISATNSTVAHCTANYNASDGIVVGNSIVSNSNVYSNGHFGINGHDSLFQGCNARSNTQGGINGYTNSYVFRCSAGDNGTFQIRCVGGSTCSDNASF